jgi:putative SOS response-associated peptidase YedK
MCANYIPASPDHLTRHFKTRPLAYRFVDESFPGYMAPIVRPPHDFGETDERECVPACFGLVPHWADMKLAKSTYNARTETVGSKPAFRHAYRARQFCVIPADAIFEPNYESGRAVRWKIAHADGLPLGIAGIWEVRSDGPDGTPLISFSMLTINADEHPLMRRFHRPGDEKRMLVMLDPDSYDSWMHAPLEHAPSFFVPYPADRLIAMPAPRPAAIPKAPKPRARQVQSGDADPTGSLF